MNEFKRKPLTREETIKEACAIIGTAYMSINDFSHASDCFCMEKNGFANDGLVLQYVRKAVEEQLKRDGFKVERI